MAGTIIMVALAGAAAYIGLRVRRRMATPAEREQGSPEWVDRRAR